MKKIFFLATALLIGLFLAQVCYATGELIWDNSPSWVASTNVESRAVRAGDLNSDGYPDLVQADYYGGQIYIYYNNGGQLPLTPSWTSSGPTGCFLDVQLGDINGDGLLDIIATNFDGRVYVFFNHSGQFNLEAEWVSNNICAYEAKTTKAADIDGDGDSDLLVQCEWDGLKLLKNDNGILTKSPTWSSSENYVWWVQFDVSDYDGDGIMEVAVPNGYANGNRNEYRTFVYKYNHATGGLDVIWNSPVAGGECGRDAVKHAYWVDYENDGDLDLITSDGKVFIYTNGILSYAPIVFYDKPVDFATNGMAVGDYNKDGLIDVILTLYYAYQGFPGIIHYFENSSNGFHVKQTILAAPIIFLAGNIDYDIDGDEDLLLTYYGSARIYSNRFVETHNKPPVANAGTDQPVSCAGANGAAVTLDGSGSSDPDNDTLTY
ncbi:MAG: VCBS repeat-containing protein, partial [Nitrospirae bacterium]|nr:VCBS repeat-containing protein [Nitrospirota bacterium]